MYIPEEDRTNLTMISCHELEKEGFKVTYLDVNEEGLIKPFKHPNNEGKKWYKMHSYFQNSTNKILLRNKNDYS